MTIYDFSTGSENLNSGPWALWETLFHTEQSPYPPSSLGFEIDSLSPEITHWLQWLARGSVFLPPLPQGSVSTGLLYVSAGGLTQVPWMLS